jgi:7,8-dihydro-6-hydroxymethylpterin dimethyltransferase
MDKLRSGLPTIQACCGPTVTLSLPTGEKTDTQQRIEAHQLHLDEATSSMASLQAIASACIQSTERDLFELFLRLRQLPDIPMHGSEHHGLLAGLVVAAYRNCGGDVGEDDVIKAIVRANVIPGRACGYLGICGAAAAMGAAFSVILDATPLRAERRQQVLQVVAKVAMTHAMQNAARCCQRECVLALKTAAELSCGHLPVTLIANSPFRCEQSRDCVECAGSKCPFYAVEG